MRLYRFVKQSQLGNRKEWLALKKIFSMLLALCLLGGVLPSALAQNETESNVAYVQFGKNGATKKNITLASMGGTATETFTYAAAGGRDGWQLSSASPYLYIDIDDNWA